MSDNNVKTVTVYDSWVKVAEMLSDEQKGQFYHSIMRYALYGEAPELTPPLDAFFALIKPSIDKTNARKKAGSNGGKNKQNSSKIQAKPKQNASKTEANEQANISGDDKQNVSKQVSKEKEKVKVKEKEKVKEKNSLTRINIACECEEIAKVYPKEKIGNFRQVIEAVSRAVQREIDRGNSESDAIALVKVGTIAYAEKAKRMKHKRFIMQPVKFFDNGIYNNDPETWDFSEENNGSHTTEKYDWRKEIAE